VSAEIRFEQVSLQFPDGERPWQLMVAVARLDRSASLVILGPPAAAKQLLKMVKSAWPRPTAGKIYLDSTDIRDEECVLSSRWLCYPAVWLVSAHDICSKHCCYCQKLLGWSRAKFSPALMNC